MTEPKRILVIQLRRLGDVLLTTPALEALKKRYPASLIDFLVEPPCDQVLSQNPNLHQVLSYRADGWLSPLAWCWRIRQARYDWVIDFMGNPRSAILTALSAAPMRAGFSHVSHRWAYNHYLVQSSATHYAGLEKIRVLASLGVMGDGVSFLPKIYWQGPAQPPENIIGLAPASRRVTRRWPAGQYARLGRLLIERYGCRIFVFCGPGERALAQEVALGIGAGALAPETPDIASLSRLMSKCRLLVTNCSGPKHLGVALGVPTVTIHGSSDPVSWNPPHPKHVIVRRDSLFCIGCALNRCPYDLECLRELAPETVFEAAARLIDRKSVSPISKA